MKEQRGITTSRFEEKTHLNTIVYCAFKDALKDGLAEGISKDLPRNEFIMACGLKGNDPALLLAYDVVVRGKKE